jgi:hypothetical protein
MCPSLETWRALAQEGGACDSAAGADAATGSWERNVAYRRLTAMILSVDVATLTIGLVSRHQRRARRHATRRWLKRLRIRRRPALASSERHSGISLPDHELSRRTSRRSFEQAHAQLPLQLVLAHVNEGTPHCSGGGPTADQVVITCC